MDANGNWICGSLDPTTVTSVKISGNYRFGVDAGRFAYRIGVEIFCCVIKFPVIGELL